MPGYYAEKLSAERLKRCYDLATPAVAAYLENEIQFIISRLRPHDHILELGCGYGRVLSRLRTGAQWLCGIDTSLPSLLAVPGETASLVAADAVHLPFLDRSFDLVLCVQNGISAFAVDPQLLFQEAVRVTRPGGRLLFSTYAEKFWPERLGWFEIQAANGLIGKLDYQQTGNGTIVCKDGFRATTATPETFRELARRLGLQPNITEIGGSSLFCEMVI